MYLYPPIDILSVQRRTLARSLTLPTFQVAKDFASLFLQRLLCSSLWFATPSLAADHFRLLALSCGLIISLILTVLLNYNF